MKPSTSTIFRNFESRFASDADVLEKSIAATKELARKNENSAVRDVRTKPSYQKWTGSNPMESPCSMNSNSPISKKAVELRGMTEQRFNEVISGWKKQNAKLESEINEYRNYKNENKKKLEEKTSEIFSFKRQNEKLENLLRKCEVQISKLLESDNARDTNRAAANSLECRLIESKNKLADLEIKMEETTCELYKAKEERNNLLQEAFDLRKENKILRDNVQNHKNDYDDTNKHFEELENTLANLEANGIDNPLREAPSAMTALNTLRHNHEVECEALRSSVADFKQKVNKDKIKLEKLKGALQAVIQD